MEQIQVIRSQRKTIALRINPDSSLELRVPLQASNAQIQMFLQQKAGWIEKHLQSVKERQKRLEQTERITNEELHELAEQALAVIPKRVAYFAEKMGVTYGRITIRNQKSRWGSCSSKGNLNFNCLLMLAPPEVQDYIVVHELCHRKEMNHSVRFWCAVEKIMPDYREQEKWLKTHGDEIMMRMFGLG